MSAAETSDAARPTRFGLAAKLFAILILLGAVAVLITGVLGYVRARDALEQTIFNQLTATRETKSHQVEIYFRSIRAEMRLLAHSKMVVDAMRGFHGAVDELDARPVPDEVRKRVVNWYETDYMPRVRRLLGDNTPIEDFLPVGSAPYFLQDWYIVDNPYPKDRRKLVDDHAAGGAYNKLHATYHPLMRTAASTLSFADFLLVDHRSSRIIYSVEKEAEFGTSLRAGPYRNSNLAAAAARCGQAPDPSATCLEDFADYLPSNGSAAGLHGGAGDRPGRGDRRAGGPALDRRDRQDRHQQPALAPRGPGRHRRGLPGRSGLPPPLQPAHVLRESRPLFRAS